jgi:hypothetical protein
MKYLRFFLGIVLFTGTIFATSAQKAKIDFRYNVIKEDSGNYFNWSAGDKTVKDGFDVKTGASKAGSTSGFDSVRYDATGKAKTMPSTLRYLMLYPVSARSVAEGDNLTVTANGKQLVIRFIHRGNAFEVFTDKNGIIDLPDSFKIGIGLANNIGGKFLLKDEYVKDGGDKTKAADANWSKIQLVADTADTNATYKYKGTLKAEYKNGILTIKGTLSK